MKRKDFLLTLLVVLIWGTTFTVIKLGITGMPSLVLVAGRYFFTFFPAIFFIKKPNVPSKYILLYGSVSGVLQLATQFYALEIGMPAGIGSVILQSAAFFTPIFAYFLLKESLGANKIIGLLIAACGLILIGRSKTQGISYIPITSIALTLTSAALWGLSNIIIKNASNHVLNKNERFDSFSLIIWSSLIPPVPLLGLSFVIYPKEIVLASLQNIHLLSFIAMLYLTFFGTLFGYGVWNYLISSYSASKIAPFSLLVPVSGFITAFIVLEERVTKYQFSGALIIILGLAVANFGFSNRSH